MDRLAQNLVLEIFYVCLRPINVPRYIEKLNKSNGENPSTLSFTVLKLWTGKLKIWFLRKG